jgi:hypothetical protein
MLHNALLNPRSPIVAEEQMGREDKQVAFPFHFGHTETPHRFRDPINSIKIVCLNFYFRA